MYYFLTTTSAVLGIILFSLIAFIINYFNSYEAFQFQLGLISNIDTKLLEEYKSLRDIFIYLGAIIGAVTPFIKSKSNSPSQN